MDREQVAGLLARLNEVRGISGREDAVGALIERELAGAFDEAQRDALGNRMFIKRGMDGGPTVLLSAHMDEIGFLVSDIDDEGFVHFVPVGFHDERLLQNQVMLIQTARGEVPGVTGSGAPPHETKGAHPAPAAMGTITLDIGARTRSEALDMGVQPGDALTSDRGGRMLGPRLFTGRAVDNRAGCAAMVAAMRQLAGTQTAATVAACASVQEELGAKGARAAARRVQPDVALALDVCFAVTGRAVPPNRSRVYVGSGPAVQAYDWSPGSLLGNIVPVRLRDRLVATAKRRRIPYQVEVTLDCGTDAAELAQCGVPAGGVGIPCRYMHSAVGVVDVGDVYYAAKLVAEFIKGL